MHPSIMFIKNYSWDYESLLHTFAIQKYNVTSLLKIRSLQWDLYKHSTPN